MEHSWETKENSRDNMQYHAKKGKEFVESSCSLPQDTEMQCDYNVKGKNIYSIITIYFYKFGYSRHEVWGKEG